MAKIFETPDGGETVYSRESGSTDRTLHSTSPKAMSMHDRIQEDQLWGNIRRMGKTHPGMQAELDRVIMFYNLIKNK